ncbi:hypothetical protein ES703_93473 [subsurface metagenome]
MNAIELFRAIVRPFIGITFSTTILVIAVILLSKFASAELANQFATFLLATGAVITGFYFGERSQKPKT